MATTDSDGFLSRWSRRKVQAQRGEVLAEPPAPAPAPMAAPVRAEAATPAVPVAEARPAPEPPPPAPPPPPTLDDVARLPADAADFSRFVAPNVQADVKNAALKKLFSDPHFNVMDGLDIYIDDYSRPDPLPAGWLEKMALNQFVGLVTEPTELPAPDDGPTAPVPAAQVAPEPAEAAPQPLPPAHEDTDLQLQPDHDAGRASVDPDAGRPAGQQR